MIYLSVIVDNNTNATDELYTYGCTDPSIKKGDLVRVPFGRYNKQLNGYVAAVLQEPPADIPIEKIKTALPPAEAFSLTEEAMDTALWMHRRYLCRYIEAVKCFLPTALSPSGRAKDPFKDLPLTPDTAKELNEPQADALQQIERALEKKAAKTFLLFGVTGSGKTEVYLQAMEKTAAMGRQGIILVPEISLTPQTVARFMNRFGKEAVAVLHSRLTAAQRAAEYQRIRSGEARLVIGARSAIFAPFQDIGLIVLDEEHETSYKSDKSPKYDTVELATRRAQANGAVLVLGSATPSVSDYYRAEQGLFEILTLKSRYNDTPLPHVRIVDMTAELKAGNRSPFSREMAARMQSCLEQKKQVILFLNRRGYSSYVSCRECGFVIQCPECGISMTYHKSKKACECHYCGRRAPVPQICPQCGGRSLGLYGMGTEQVQEKCAELFPQAVIERVDLDTVSKKGSLESLLKRFGSGKTDILIGTQLVAKGLDFANVGLVGIISADITLNIPDFRSAERTFQLLTQAAGRAGRGDEQGEVIIQTCSPENKAVMAAAGQDYLGFYRHEIALREAVMYPPFSYLYQLIVSDEDDEKAQRSANRCAQWLRKKLGEEAAVLGPVSPGLVKQGGLFRWQILIKAPAQKRHPVSEVVLELKRIYAKQPGVAQLLTIDINPYSFM